MTAQQFPAKRVEGLDAELMALCLLDFGLRRFTDARYSRSRKAQKENGLTSLQPFVDQTNSLLQCDGGLATARPTKH